MASATLHYSDADGEHVVALDQASTSLGRAPSQAVILSGAYVSRQHALILNEGDSYSVVDQGSAHGTFINLQPIARATLKAGDVLQLGSLSGPRIRFETAQDMAATSVQAPAPTTGLLSSLEKLKLSGAEMPPAVREMEKLNWLLSAARQLNEGGAIADILDAFLHLALQLTGLGRGFIFLPQEGDLKFSQGLAADGTKLQEDSTISRSAIRKAIDSHSRFSISDTLSDDQSSQWQSVMLNSIRSIYCIPLRRRTGGKDGGQLLGLVYLDSQLRAGQIAEVDHQLLDKISTDASALLQNALLAEAETQARAAQEELSIAARIHRGLMSITLPSLPYAKLQARSVPCLAIGGDFYDAVALPDCLCVALADVSGKGVSAAIVAATLQGILHSQLLAGQTLPQIASSINEFLCGRNVGKYATMVVVKLYPDGAIEYMNCGHIHPLIVSASAVRPLQESNLVVGLIPGAEYTAVRSVLQPGERLLLVTDGVTEAENEAGAQFGDGELMAVVQQADFDSLMAQVANFHAPAPAQDDCTLVELQYLAAG
jgi:sigma-B regulation protein RsbU (phosphoserine phosphatase)